MKKADLLQFVMVAIIAAAITLYIGSRLSSSINFPQPTTIPAIYPGPVVLSFILWMLLFVAVCILFFGLIIWEALCYKPKNDRKSKKKTKKIGG